MKVTLLVHPTRISDEMLAKDVLPGLDRMGITYEVIRRVATDEYVVSADSDMILVLGGDGTFLAGARLAVRHGLPILGIMVGRLGFLCMVPLSDMYNALQLIADGRMHREQRSILAGRICGADGTVRESLAINDIVVSKSDTEKIRDIVARQNELLVAQYRVDGIILSSATGSTAYNLSAGGPLVHPSLSVIILTPICAHSLFTKPLVLPPEQEVEIEALPSSYPLSVSFDGMVRMEMDEGDSLKVMSHPTRLSIYSPVEYDFYDVLRQKFQHGYMFGGGDD
jgi:NAD+ kinase